ncbi:MAG TPA: alpha-amylase family glycosyl hydrolase, partial [Verrucomicrobiales bacterium]|nr:alpha-amylase family glycosyl hydrolase [Verrucomicrobiales bacterium]
MSFRTFRAAISLTALTILCSRTAAQQEVILQYFNTSWTGIDARIPELAEAGYSALWLPSPSKGASGTYSVGYDVFDRFDLGDRDQSGGIPTRYGTKAELLALVEKAHRFGIRVYFDNIMAHNGGPLSNVPPGTLFPYMPGFVPEDFHLVKRNGQWAKASDSIDYNDEWQVLNRNPFAWDIAQENPNTSFNPTGTTEGQDYPKWSGIRQPGMTWYYPDTGLQVDTDGNGVPVYPFADKEPYTDSGWGPSHTGAGNGRFDWNDTNGNGQHDAGEASEPFTDTGVDPSHPDRRVAAWGFGDGRYNMGNPVPEDVNAFLNRAARYVVDQTKCDGFRLDAVKHVPSYFFGKQSGADKDRSDNGYSGQIQVQFNLSHGYTD